MLILFLSEYECDESDERYCSGHGECVDGSCLCDPGWSGNWTTMQDIVQNCSGDSNLHYYSVVAEAIDN